MLLLYRVSGLDIRLYVDNIGDTFIGESPEVTVGCVAFGVCSI